MYAEKLTYTCIMNTGATVTKSNNACIDTSPGRATRRSERTASEGPEKRDVHHGQEEISQHDSIEGRASILDRQRPGWRVQLGPEVRVTLNRTGGKGEERECVVQVRNDTRWALCALACVDHQVQDAEEDIRQSDCRVREPQSGQRHEDRVVFQPDKKGGQPGDQNCQNAGAMEAGADQYRDITEQDKAANRNESECAVGKGEKKNRVCGGQHSRAQRASCQPRRGDRNERKKQKIGRLEAASSSEDSR